MTQQQRRQVWERRDHLTAQLWNLPKTEANAEARAKLQEKIEACNTELISNVFNPPADGDQSSPPENPDDKRQTA